MDGFSDDGTTVDDTKVIVDDVSLLQSLDIKLTNFYRN